MYSRDAPGLLLKWEVLCCAREILAGSSFGWFAFSHSQAEGCAALLLTETQRATQETGAVIQATQKAQVGHLQVAVALGTSRSAHPSSPIPPGKLAVHTSAPVWVTPWEGLFFAAPHLWGNLKGETEIFLLSAS